MATVLRPIGVLIANIAMVLALSCGGDGSSSGPDRVATISSGAATAVSGTVTTALTPLAATVTRRATVISGTVTAGGTVVSGTARAVGTAISGTPAAIVTSVTGQQGGSNTELCSAATDLKSSLESLDALTSSSTVGEVQQAYASAQQAFQSLLQAAQQLYADAAGNLQASFDNLRAEVKSLTGSTVGQNSGVLQGYVTITILANSNLANLSACPGF
jgi:hypothetical protein